MAKAKKNSTPSPAVAKAKKNSKKNSAPSAAISKSPKLPTVVPPKAVADQFAKVVTAAPEWAKPTIAAPAFDFSAQRPPRPCAEGEG